MVYNIGSYKEIMNFIGKKIGVLSPSALSFSPFFSSYHAHHIYAKAGGHT